MQIMYFCDLPLYVVLNTREGDARTATERMWAIARYYNIFSKADRGDILSSTIKNHHIAHP